MAFSEQDLIAMQERLNRGKKTPTPPPEVLPTKAERYAVSDELQLHDEIISYCNKQFPRWKYIHANPSQKSCIAVGAQDFTLFMPGGKLLCIECKAKGGKWSIEQMAWRKEMEMLGHTVVEIVSMQEFFKLINHDAASQ